MRRRTATTLLVALGLVGPVLPHASASHQGLQCPSSWDFGEVGLPLTASGPDPEGGFGDTAWYCHYGEGDPYYDNEGARRVGVTWNEQQHEITRYVCGGSDNNGDGLWHSARHQAYAYYEPSHRNDEGDAEIIALAKVLLRQGEALALYCPDKEPDPFGDFDDFDAEVYKDAGCFDPDATDLDPYQPVARLVSVVGTVEYNNGAGWKPAAEGIALSPKAGIRVANGIARLEFLDDRRPGGGNPTIVDLLTGSTFCVLSFVIAEQDAQAAEARREGVVSLLQGFLRVLTKNWKNGSIFSVKAGTTIAGGIRGTDAAFRVDRDTDTVTMMVDEGDATYRIADGPEVRVEPGTQVDFRGGVAEPAEPLDHATYVQLVAGSPVNASAGASPAPSKALPGPDGLLGLLVFAIAGLLGRRWR